MINVSRNVNIQTASPHGHIVFSLLGVNVKNLGEHIAILSAVDNAYKLGVEADKLVQYFGYICKSLNEHNTELLVLAYKDPYMKMGAWDKYDLSTVYVHRVGETIEIGFEYLHQVKDFPADQ